jgi:hypothetical protein
MSSQLTSLVPVMDGTNYQQWAASMQSFLMSQGQWKCTKPNALAPNLKSTDDEITNQSEVDDWNETAEKALGNIRLRLHYTIGYQYNDVYLPSALWGALATKYGAPGFSGAYLEFKGAMDTVIPNGSDPSPALDKIMAHFTRLETMKYKIPAKMQVMMLISKAPPNMESMIQLMTVKLQTELEKEESEQVWSPADAILAMRASWETHQRSGAKGKQPQHANKLSAVKPGQGQPPSFQQQQQQFQQQQQRGEGQGRGRGRRGKRGGQKSKQQQLQGATAQQQQVAGPPGYPPFLPQGFFVPSQGPPQPGPSTPVPGQYQWVHTPEQYQPPAPPPNATNYFASKITAGRPLPNTPPVQYKSPYPSFNSALSLAHRIGAPVSTETLKTLEAPSLGERSEDPRPSKKARTKELPTGKSLGQWGSIKGKAKDDEEVSLDYSGDEGFGDDVMDAQEDLFNNLDFGQEGEIGDSAGLDMQLQVQSAFYGELITNSGLQLDNYIAVPLNKTCCSCSHKCDCKPVRQKEWIIDSGASFHFTNSLDDFVDYEELKDKQIVRTANSSASIEGKGTIILVLSKLVARIYPVYYVPTLTCNLLSMGTFLQTGLRVTGDSRSIRIMKGSNPFLTFSPKDDMNSIFVINSRVAREADLHVALDTIYSINYETLHR